MQLFVMIVIQLSFGIIKAIHRNDFLLLKKRGQYCAKRAHPVMCCTLHLICANNMQCTPCTHQSLVTLYQQLFQLRQNLYGCHNGGLEDGSHD